MFLRSCIYVKLISSAFNFCTTSLVIFGLIKSGDIRLQITVVSQMKPFYHEQLDLTKVRHR